MRAGLTLSSVAFFALVVGIAGCGSSGDKKAGGGASLDELAGAVDAQNAAAKQREAEQAAKDKAAQDAAAAAAQPAEPEKQVAGRAPVAAGGSYYKSIIGARRHVLNRVEDLAWVQGVQHFQATEGRLPKDHDEFMKKIVEPLGINLGYKEEGQEFLYDPHEGQWGEVYVVEKEPAK